MVIAIDFLGRKSIMVREERNGGLPMPDFAKALGASKGASTFLVLFIPSRDRSDQAHRSGVIGSMKH